MKKIVFITLNAVLYPLISVGAGFNCNEAKTHVETTICHHSYLSELDSQMADAYFQLLNTSRVNKSELKKSQKSWLKSRETLCFEENKLNTSSVECLSKLYESRISELLAHPLSGSDLPD